MGYDYGNYLNVGMDWNSLMNDPYFMAAWNTQNANGYYSNVNNNSLSNNGTGSTTQTSGNNNISFMGTSGTSNTPANKIPQQKSGSGAGTVITLGVLATGALALIAGAKKGKLDGVLSGIKSFVNGNKTRAMKEFSLIAEDGSKVVVKDGKILNIFRNGKNEVLKGERTVSQYLTKNSLKVPSLADGHGKLREGFELIKYEYNFDGYRYIVENGEIKQIFKGNKKVKSEDFEKIANKVKNTVQSLAKGDASCSTKAGDIVAHSYNYRWKDNPNILYTVTGGNRPVKSLTITPKTQICLTETERNAYLHQNQGVEKAVEELIARGKADKVQRTSYWFNADNGDRLLINKDGQIEKIKLKDGEKQLVKGSTEYHDYLYKNKSIEEAAKKDFESGLATDNAGTVFAIAS